MQTLQIPTEKLGLESLFNILVFFVPSMAIKSLKRSHTKRWSNWPCRPRTTAACHTDANGEIGEMRPQKSRVTSPVESSSSMLFSMG